MWFSVQADGTTGENCVHLGIVSIAFDRNRAAFLNGFDLFFLRHHECESYDAPVRIDNRSSEFHR